MPELPEVETVKRGLAPVMEGRRIECLELRRADLRWPFPEGLAEEVQGATVLRLRRRSKYLLIDLSTHRSLIVHLGMSGRMQVSGAQGVGVFYRVHSAPEKHDHVIFHMQDEARVTFNDPRRFGALDVCNTQSLEQHPMLAAIGPEPLGNHFSSQSLALVFKGKKQAIKQALLDQRNVAGLGNIYVCEALHRAGIHPKRQAGQVARKRLELLVPIIRTVLEEAIAAGGSSLRDHRQADGALGYFQHGFQVYDREGEPCLKEGCVAGSIKRDVQGGRSTFYCGKCQR